MLGRSNLFPSNTSRITAAGGTPSYGIAPHVNTSQHVTPKDHWKENEKREQNTQWKIMGQKKVSLLVRCPLFKACKSGTWGGKSVLFREVSSVQECRVSSYIEFTHHICFLTKQATVLDALRSHPLDGHSC